MLTTLSTLDFIFRTILLNLMIWSCVVSIVSYVVGQTHLCESFRCAHILLKDICIPRTVLKFMVYVHLWHSHRASVVKKFIVCFNNAARMFFGYDRFCTASNMFVYERIDNFDAMYRKAVFQFMRRLGQSDNRIVAALFSSDLAYVSSIRKVWSTALHTYSISLDSIY